MVFEIAIQLTIHGRCVDGTGATSPTQRTCEACSNCPVGEYKLSICTGGDAYDSYECAPCQPCLAGSYLSKPCDGAGTVGGYPDRLAVPRRCLMLAISGCLLILCSCYCNRECTPCSTCPRGHYIASDGCRKTGTMLSDSTTDDVQCLPCDPCPDGYYISPDESKQCPGTGYSAVQRSCIKCDSCGAGMYYATGCTGREFSGAHTCAPCEALSCNATSASATGCVIDSLCPVGTYVGRGCNGQTSVPRAQQCLPCDPCPEKNDVPYYISRPCTGNQFSSTSRDCKACSCPPEWGVVVDCSGNGTSDHVCSPPPGYSPSPSATAPPLALSSPPQPQIVTTTTSAATVDMMSTTPAPVAPPTPTPTPAPTPPPPPASASDKQTLYLIVAGSGVLGLVTVVGISAALLTRKGR